MAVKKCTQDIIKSWLQATFQAIPDFCNQFIAMKHLLDQLRYKSAIQSKAPGQCSRQKGHKANKGAFGGSDENVCRVISSDTFPVPV